MNTAATLPNEKGQKGCSGGVQGDGGDRREKGSGKVAREGVPFSVEETATVSQYFDQHLSIGKESGIHECREFLEHHPLQRTAKQVRDKVLLHGMLRAATSSNSLKNK